MPWIKLSDKPPKFDVLIELAFEGAVFQAMLTTITGAGATFEIYFKEKTEKKILNPEETYWQDKQQGPGAPAVEPDKKKRKRKPKEPVTGNIPADPTKTPESKKTPMAPTEH